MTEKPFWQVRRDAEHDLKWLEPGLYYFRCDHCGGVAHRKLKARKTYRHAAKCNLCNQVSEL